eukprot:65639-Amphidinium_carterae.1
MELQKSTASTKLCKFAITESTVWHMASLPLTPPAAQVGCVTLLGWLPLCSSEEVHDVASFLFACHVLRQRVMPSCGNSGESLAAQSHGSKGLEALCDTRPDPKFLAWLDDTSADLKSS